MCYLLFVATIAPLAEYHISQALSCQNVLTYFSNPMFGEQARIIGRDGADRVIVRIDATRPPERQQIVQCTISLQLADGQITAQGLAQGTENYFAVTGGTGTYPKCPR